MGRLPLCIVWYRNTLSVLIVTFVISLLQSLPVFAAQITADSLVGYWKLDETSGTNAADSSGGGNTGTHTNSPTISTDVPSAISFPNARSLSFDGVDDHIVSANNIGLTGDIDATISFWSNLSSAGGVWYRALVAFGQTGNGQGMAIFAGDTGRLTVGFYGGLPYAGQSNQNVVTAGQWYHIVATKTAGVIGSSTTKLYVNGVLQSLTFSGFNTPNVAAGKIYIGTDAVSEVSNPGLIDDVRIYNRALSATEISELAAGRHIPAYWNGTTSTGFENKTNWSGSYIPDPYSRITIQHRLNHPIMTGAIQAASLTINTGASLRTSGTGITLKDSGTFTNYGTLQIKGTETLTNLTNSTNKGTVLVFGTGAITSLPTGLTYYNLNLNDGLVGYWKLDATSGTRAVDSSGYSNSGTLINGPTITSSTAPTRFHNPRALSFDGTDDYVKVGDILSIKTSGSSFTLSAFIYRTSDAPKGIVAYRQGGGGWVFAHDVAGKLQFYDGAWKVSSLTVPLNTWSHVAVSYSGNTPLNFYLNSTLSSVSGSAPTGDGYVSIGAWDNGAFPFHGLIDDVRIYNRALSAGEIAALAAGNQPSTGRATLTLNGALDVNNNLILNGGTLDVSSSNYGINVGGSWMNNGGKFTQRKGTVTFDGTSAGLEILSGGQRFNAVTFNGAGATWNLRDRFAASGALTLTAGTLDASGSYVIRAGSWTQNSGTFTPRSGTVVLDGSASAAFTPSSAFNILRIEDPTENGLIGYWKFDEGTNTGAILDSSGYGNTGTRRGGSGKVWTGSTLPSLQFDNPLAMSFDGVDDYVDVGANSIFSPANITVSLWTKNIVSPLGYDTIIGNSTFPSDSWNKGWGMYYNSSSTVYFFIQNYGLNVATASISATQWNHIVGTWDGTTVRIYVNGIEGTSDSYSGAMTAGDRLTIGQMNSSTYNINGLIDDVRIYNRALSANEIANLARGRYASGNSSTATHTLAGNLSAATLALDSGNLATSSSTLTVTNALTLLRGGGNLTLGSALASLNGGLTLSGVTLTGASGTLDINGSLLMLTGSLIAPSGTFTVSGNWNKTGGTFTHNSGTVQFDGTNQTLSGSLVFYNLTKTVTSADTFKFAWNGVVSVSGALTLRGTGSNVLTVRSTKSGTKAGLILDGDTGSQTIDYVNVNDHDATGGLVLVCLIASEGCTNGGNTTNWVFTLPTVYFSLSTLTRSETSGSASLLVHLSGTTLLTVTVPYSLGGTATGTGTDYTAFTPSPLIIRAGQTNTGLILLLTDDSDVESDETIILTLGTPTNASLGSTGSSLTLTLTSDDVAASPPPPPPPPAQGTSGGGGGGHRGSPQSMQSKITAAYETIFSRFSITQKESENIIIAEDRKDTRAASIAKAEEEQRREARIADRIKTHEASILILKHEKETAAKNYALHREDRLAKALALSEKLLADEQAALESQKLALEQERAANKKQREERLAQRDASKDSQAASLPPDVIAARRGRLFAVIDNEPVMYRDVPLDSWFAPFVTYVVTEGIAEGYRTTEGKHTGEFGAEKSVTYGEVLKMALEAADVQLTGGKPRNLSAQGSWVSAYVTQAEILQLSVFSQTLDVHAPATRGAVIQTVLEVLDFPIPKTPSTFSDVPTTHPYSAAIGLASYFGFITGDTSVAGIPLNTFRPDEAINRAEAAKIIALARESRSLR